MRRHLGAALLLAALLASCMITFNDAEQSKEAPVKPVWDLRNSHRIEDVGWPGGQEGSTYKVDPSSPAGGRVGVVQLIPTWQHTPGSIWQRVLHSDGTGGYSEWAMPRGVPPN